MPRRNPLQREQDLLELSRRYVRKFYKDFDTRERQEVIAKDFGVSQVMISKDIQTLKARWKAAAMKEVSDAIGEALTEIEEVMGEAWLGWQSSVEPKEKEVKQKTEVEGGGGGGKDGEGKSTKGKRTSFQVQTSKIDSSGNPAYLNIILECLRQVREIRGLDKPKKFAPTNPEGTESYKGAADLTDDELAAIASSSSDGTADETES